MPVALVPSSWKVLSVVLTFVTIHWPLIAAGSLVVWIDHAADRDLRLAVNESGNTPAGNGVRLAGGSIDAGDRSGGRGRRVARPYDILGGSEREQCRSWRF